MVAATLFSMILGYYSRVPKNATFVVLATLLIHIIEVAAVGGIVIKGAGGAGDASSIIGITANADAGGGVSVIVA
jgi:hypothetical protein